MKQLRVYFSGRVQGVGFRATTQHIARRFQINGWVRNRRDGRVEVLAVGDEALLLKFLGEIAAEMRANIEGREIEWSEAEEKLSGFRVRATE